MNKIILIFFIALGILFEINAYAHTDHYKNIKSIEMEIFKDNKYIGFSKFFFNKTQKKFEVTNTTNFEVKLMGITVFSIISEGLEIYENDQLIYFKSDTVQNDKKKFVEVFFDEENRNFKINGSSYKGTGNLENIIGNWWNHRLLQSDTQISPLSGSIKKQSVEFLKKEKIRLYENEINVDSYLQDDSPDYLRRDNNFSQNDKDNSIPLHLLLHFQVLQDFVW